jgi:hypothetical protein
VSAQVVGGARPGPRLRERRNGAGGAAGRCAVMIPNHPTPITLVSADYDSNRQKNELYLLIIIMIQKIVIRILELVIFII